MDIFKNSLQHAGLQGAAESVLGLDRILSLLLAKRSASRTVSTARRPRPTAHTRHEGGSGEYGTGTLHTGKVRASRGLLDACACVCVCMHACPLGAHLGDEGKVAGDSTAIRIPQGNVGQHFSEWARGDKAGPLPKYAKKECSVEGIRSIVCISPPNQATVVFL